MNRIIFISIVIMVGCNTVQRQREVEFHTFLKKFHLLKLPLKINPYTNLDYEHTDKLPDVISVPADTMFLDSFTKADDRISHETKAYGMLSDTDSCYHVIWLVPVSVYQPCLVTYSKTGQEMSVDMISVGECGADMCDSCNENTIIRSDYTVYAADTIWDKCGEGDTLIPGWRHRYVIYMTGKINHHDKPVFSDRKRMD